MAQILRDVRARGIRGATARRWAQEEFIGLMAWRKERRQAAEAADEASGSVMTEDGKNAIDGSPGAIVDNTPGLSDQD